MASKPESGTARSEGVEHGRPLSAWSFLDGRLFRPEMLMIGATGRNSGKTELACALTRRYAAATPVVGLKVTTVERTDGTCPRGGHGCEVCSSLNEPWLLTREDGCESSKDTARLLSSGACEVYWFRVLRSALEEGAQRLVETTPPGRVSVCETNSLRHVVEPGLFLQVHLAKALHVKPSARAVASLVDRVVVSDGATFDLAYDRLSIVDGQWALRREAAGVVLSRGELPPEEVDDSHAATRVAHLRALRAHVDDVRVALSPEVSLASQGSHSARPARGERLSDSSWLIALHDALAVADHDLILVVPESTPLLPAGIVNAMFRRGHGNDAVVLTEAPGAWPPLAGLYRSRFRDALAALLDAGEASPRALLDRLMICELPLRARKRARSPGADERCDGTSGSSRLVSGRRSTQKAPR